MVKYCPYCGIELEADYKFCPDCGKQVPTGKKGAKPEKEKTPEKAEAKEEVKTKEQEKPKEKAKKKAKFKFKLPKLSLKKVTKKTAIIIVAIICIAAVMSVAAYVVVVNNPFAATVSPTGGRTFTVTVTNDFGSDAECYLKIDKIKQLDVGLIGFTVNASGTEIFTINEDDLDYYRDAYEITLYAMVGDIEEFATTTAVTGSAEFLIDNVEGQINNFYVNCTAYQ